MPDWLLAPLPDLLVVVLTAVGTYAALVVFTRLVGLRSFSKMSSYDFAMTVAIGSTVASVILSPGTPLLRGVVALASLYALQFAVGWVRARSRLVEHVVDNTPLLLMAGAEMIEANLLASRVNREDVWAKLREANVLDPAQVRAVVLETTGDISVLHGPPDGTPLHPALLTNVRDRARALPPAGGAR